MFSLYIIIRVLTKENGNIRLKGYIDETYGRTVEQLLLSIFDLESVRDINIQEKLDEYKNMYMCKDKLNKEALKKMNDLRNEIYKYIDPNDPELALINIEKTTVEMKEVLEKLKEKKNNDA
jgi:hypothetical protein